MAKKRTKAQEKFSREVQQHMETERKGTHASQLSNVILGGQDGLVNVLGIVLGVASATNDKFIVLIAGLVATFAESISMAAVAYTSSRAEQDHYRKELANEEWEIDNKPDVEREEIRLIYMKKGYRGKELDQLVKSVTSNRQVWLSVMMSEELGLTPIENVNPVRNGIVVGISATVGSLVPLAPFLFMGVNEAIPLSLAISTIVLFAVGAYKAKLTVGSWVKSGVEVAAVGMIAAISGYLIGTWLGDFFGIKGVPVG